ncbi:large ribosomal subunit protein eL28-like [Artemia franciscana]|uniref:Large ribosomal subunit protein eL28 n=1 Tax=Artemia franciscana TaxID=6661 RepID=A0AA88L5J2_ARTSF|nr:hypothetical protein QYM36_004965 [Artemia franciscana]KAK2719322.1 hypothetical protein QYM36_004965 [Artemia franciscana]KAK2719323.1 hypothetical protein QYM36_004965 [Artemia franciscana]
MSSSLVWEIIGKNSAFILKKRNLKHPFNTERNHITNTNTYRHSTLVHRRTVGIEEPKDKRGIVLVANTHAVRKPAKSIVKMPMKYGPRRANMKLRNFLVKGGYRKDLRAVALKRASKIMRTQRTPKVRKEKATKA